MISERSPAGMNSRMAPFANSRRGSAKSNLSEGSANAILVCSTELSDTAFVCPVGLGVCGTALVLQVETIEPEP